LTARRVAGSNDILSDVGAAQALFAATFGGARAMGLDDQIGSLEAGKQADIAVVNLDGSHQQPLSNPADTLVFSSSGRDVVLTVVAGKEIYRDGVISTVAENGLKQRLRNIRSKLDASS
jgi:5-methylthioadenosine/S-adenosylhomocysteine deaminase